jgi:dienelactone hydrolase
MNAKKIFILTIIILPIIALAGFSIWAYTPLGPMEEALDALENSPSVIVEETEWIVFSPVNNKKNTGLIFYPGGRVDPRSYAPAAHKIAAMGIKTVIVPMPFNLAVFGADKAAAVIEEYPDIERWIIAGHSLGGSMAARFAINHLEDVDGLVLWAAYPASGDDFKNTNLETASVFGNLDGLVSTEDIQSARSLLPDSNLETMIDGGNHSQFGWYGDQPGDNPAEITREEQQSHILDATLQIIKE